jgi:hypothetical protein
MYVFLERLAQGVFFEVLNQERDGVGGGPSFATVVAGSQSVSVVCLIDKGVPIRKYVHHQGLALLLVQTQNVTVTAFCHLVRIRAG